MTFTEKRNKRVNDPIMQRRVVEIRKAEIPCNGDRVAFVDRETKSCRHDDSKDEKCKYQRERYAIGSVMQYVRDQFDDPSYQG